MIMNQALSTILWILSLKHLKFEALGIDSYNAYFFSSGYIVFNIFEENHIFELGQAKYQALATYLTQYKIS